MQRGFGSVSVTCLLVVAIACGLTGLVVETAAAASWSIDTIGGSGGYTSIALDGGGNPHIAYFAGSWDLYYARWTGSAWAVEAVDTANDVGVEPSIDVDSSNHAHISYYDASFGDLKYAEWTGTDWTISTVDSTNDVGQYSSLALDSGGKAQISYLDMTNRDLKCAKWTGSSWSISTVDSGGFVGQYSSIALDALNNAGISYYDMMGTNLKYARWTGSSWNVETVDWDPGTGYFSSIELTPGGTPYISYLDFTTSTLKYARWTGTVWNIATVDSVGGFSGVSDYTSLALDGGNGHISYYDAANDDLRYAYWTGTAWSKETVDSAGSVGQYSSIALGSGGRPHISYRDGTNGLLKYATTNNPPNTPSMPSGPTSGSSGVSYAYTTSATDPDSDQVKYRFDWGDGNTSETGYVDSGVAAGQSHAWTAQGVYSVKAMALDGRGATSAWSNALTVTISNKAPDPPTGLTATPGDAVVSLSWNAPGSNGGSPITNYSIYRGTSSDGETFLIEIGNVTAYSDTSVTNGWTYCYKVTAENVVGEGLFSNEASATPIGKPAAPSNLQAVAGRAQIALTWSASVSDGGSPITNYRIFRGTASNMETFLVEIGNVTSHMDSGLGNGQTFYYKVTAKSALGESMSSNEAFATTFAVPGAPGSLTAVAGTSYISLTWTAPASNGGSPVLNYMVYRGTSSGGEIFLVKLGNVLAYTDVNVNNGVTYFYTVAASSIVGQGQNSTEASAALPAAPSEPLNLQAVPDDGEAVLTWAAPASDGGSQINYYRVYRGTASGGETLLTTLGNVLTYANTGLTNGQPYYYEVTAINDIGESPRSNEASATPATTPGAPADLTAAAGNAQVSLAWSLPAIDGGSPIANYAIWRGTSPGIETYLAEVGVSTSVVDTGLTNGKNYYYTVSARNAAGYGPNSTEASATPGSVPSQPLNLQATQGEGRVTLTWESPADDGGFQITGYRVYRGTASGSHALLVELGVAQTYVDTGVANGQTYCYVVKAVNAAGEGPQSEEASATPTSQTPPSDNDKSMLSEPWLWLLIVMVIFIIVSIAVLMKRRKAKGAESTESESTLAEEEE